ncbi:MAG TPA: DUF885 family protein, partial [Flavobacterium sp.]
MLLKFKQLISGTLILLVITTLSTTKIFAQPLTKNKALSQLFDNYYEERLKLFPLEATSIGDNRYNDLLPNDGSAQYRKQLHEFYLKYKNLLAGYKRGSLNETDKISYDILKDILNKSLEAEKLHPEYMPFAQFSSLPLTIGKLGSGKGNQPFTTVQDYENWVKRMTAFSTWTDTSIANF